MKYRLIAFDVDNTLIDHRKQLTPRVEQSIKKATAAGCNVVISSGRSYVECEELFKRLPEIRYFVGNSGSTVMDAQNCEYLFSAAFTPDESRQVFEKLHGLDCMVTIHAGPWLYIENSARENLAHYETDCYTGLFNASGTWIDSAEELAVSREDVFKIDIFFHSVEDKLAAEQSLKGFNASMSGGTRTNLELIPGKCTKGTGLQMLSKYLEIPIENVAACGDANNDISMIKAAGLGIAVGNADDDLKTAADVIVADCDHDGAAEAIELILSASAQSE